jgi:hypothetical protein
MTWNHRVFVKRTDEGLWYSIRETFYEDGEVKGWTKDEIAPASESLEGLKWVLEQMLKALDKPVLEDSDDNG